ILGLPFTVTNVEQGLLANDVDADGDSPLTARLDTAPAHGTVALNEDGTFTYTPDAGSTSPDSFTYRANDGLEDPEPARVKLGNSAPVAANDPNYVAFGGQTLTVSGIQGVLANDTDGDGDPLTAVLETGPAHGTLDLNTDGSFRYTPA